MYFCKTNRQGRICKIENRAVVTSTAQYKSNKTAKNRTIQSHCKLPGWQCHSFCTLFWQHCWGQSDQCGSSCIVIYFLNFKSCDDRVEEEVDLMTLFPYCFIYSCLYSSEIKQKEKGEMRWGNSNRSWNLSLKRIWVEQQISHWEESYSCWKVEGSGLKKEKDRNRKIVKWTAK